MFTDIEGSTVRWDRNPTAMQQAVRRHDALMRDAIDAAGGVVFKTIGDAFCAVFWTAADGLQAALCAQRTLAAEDFREADGVRVRMALHVGTSDERDNDYFGPTLNRVARLLAIGHGGQVLLSQAAAEECARVLPDGVELRDMGEHRLKDLTAPERVFQLVVPDLPVEFPALKSLSVLDNNLPQQLTSFIGRDEDLAEIKSLLEANRLVTLFGTGGVGKTRLSLQVGADVLDRFSDGVWFADLAPLADSSLVANVVGSIFSVRESSNRPMLDTLVDHLRNKRLLLIVDNCEHVIGEATKVVGALMRSCPGIKVLATSREALNIPGEVVFRLATLSFPTSSRGLVATAALGYGAVALFEARARAASPRFAVTDENAGSVAEICRRLDGIPLAIELAAARVKVLPVRELAKKLDERFRILTGGDRTALPRQQTMRALIDWSYDTLPEAERNVFRTISIFSGGFDLQTATAVCANEELDEFDVLERLTALVDKSMVLIDASDRDPGYRLLESTRAYGREKLREQGQHDVVAALHAHAFTERAEERELEYETRPYREWLADVEGDLENVRAALTWSFAPGGDVTAGQRLAATLGRILLSFAAAEARRWTKIALERVDETTPSTIVARLALAEASLASVLNQFKAAHEAAERALALFGAQDDRLGIADSQRLAGRSLIRMGRVAEGEALLRESLETHEALGSRRVGGTVRDLGYARAAEGDLCAARELFERALALFRSNDDEENVAVTAAALAEAEFACGDPAAAVPLAQEALETMRAFGRDRMAAALLANLAAYLIALARFDEARAYAREAVLLARDVEAEASAAAALQHLAAIDALGPEQNAARAARLIGCVDERITALEVVREFTEQREYDIVLTALRALDGDKLAEQMRDGSRLTLDAAITVALTSP